MASQPSLADTEFMKRVQTALYAFQMVEEALKLIVGLSYEILQSTAPDPIAFSFQPSDINNAALGTLTKLYGRVSKNQTAKARLGEIARWRDYCAHRAFYIEFMSRGDLKYQAQKDGEGLNLATKAALDLLQEFGQEIAALQVTHRSVKKLPPSPHDDI